MNSELQTWQNEGQYFQYKIHKIFYRDEGEGPALLCLHGFPTASWDWHAIWPELTKKFRVIAPDMIGFGFSDKPADYDYSIMDQADLHEALLAELGISHCHIFAHDYGDTVAQELLARYQERLAKNQPELEIVSACFLNGGLFPESHQPLLIQKLLMSPIGFLISKRVSEKIARKRFYSIFGKDTQPSERKWQNFWTLMSFNNGVKISYRLIRYMRERKIHRERWVGALQNSKIPMRLIDGPVDPVSGLHLAERYRALVSNADVVLLDGIGHYPQVEAPVKTLAAFDDFIIQKAFTN